MRISVDTGHSDHQPIIANVTTFDDDGVQSLRECIRQAQEAEQSVLLVNIDSYGGEAYSLLAMVDLLESAKRTMTVCTAAIGKAMSCGGFLLACGSPGYRFCSPNGTVMLHKLTGGVTGNPDDVKIESKEMTRLNKKVFKILGDHTGKGASFWLEKVASNTDLYLTPAECRRFKIIDKIHLPIHHRHVEVTDRIV